MVVLIGVIVAIMCVFLLRMYTLAAVSPDERAVADADSMTYQTTVEGARGCILDRNGNVLSRTAQRITSSSSTTCWPTPARRMKIF